VLSAGASESYSIGSIGNGAGWIGPVRK